MADIQIRKPIPPTPKKGRTVLRKPLDTISGLLHEQCRVYRMYVAGKITDDEYKGRMWGTSIIRQTLHSQSEMDANAALARLHERLDEITNDAGHLSGIALTGRPPELKPRRSTDGNPQPSCPDHRAHRHA